MLDPLTNWASWLDQAVHGSRTAKAKWPLGHSTVWIEPLAGWHYWPKRLVLLEGWPVVRGHLALGEAHIHQESLTTPLLLIYFIWDKYSKLESDHIAITWETNQVALCGDLQECLLATLGAYRFLNGLVILCPWSMQEDCAVLQRRFYVGLLSSSLPKEGKEHLWKS
jgi:hypothetical protein